MGLDISAFKNVKLIRANEYEPEPYEDRAVWLYQNIDFKQRSDGLVTGWYVYEECCNSTPRLSYGGYNQFRQILAGLLGKTAQDFWGEGYQKLENKPFARLINLILAIVKEFSDLKLQPSLQKTLMILKTSLTNWKMYHCTTKTFTMKSQSVLSTHPRTE